MVAEGHSMQSSYGGHHSQQSSMTSVDDVEPLPPGWSCAITKDGAIYFIKFEHVAFALVPSWTLSTVRLNAQPRGWTPALSGPRAHRHAPCYHVGVCD